MTNEPEGTGAETRQEAAMREWLEQDQPAKRPADASPPPPPGWYADPKMAQTRRYWDGHAWTDHVAPASDTTKVAIIETQRRARREDALAYAGVVMMIIFPIGGFIAGCLLLTRRAVVGTLLMLFSVASMFVWYAMFTANDSVDCSMENVERAQRGLPLEYCD